MTTLADARRQFARKRSPWMILAGVVALAVARGLIGDFSWRDAAAVAAALVVYPDQRSVPRSRTARTLGPGPVG